MQTHNYSWDCAYVVMDGAISNRLQKYVWPPAAPLKSVVTADAVFTLSLTMLFEIAHEKKYMAHSRTIDIYDHRWVCTTSWITLAEIACKSRHDPLQDHRLHDYSWDGAYVVVDNVIWNRSRKYAWPSPGPLESLITAMLEDGRYGAPGTEISAQPPLNPRTTPLGGELQNREFGNFAPTLFQDTLAYWQHRWKGRHHLKNRRRRGAYIVMDDPIWNRLQKYAWPTPEPSKSMTMAETMLTLMTYSRTIEIYGYSRGDAYIIMHYVI